MRVVAPADHKGGAGETATAITLPADLAGTDHRVLPINLDPQAGAIRELGVQDSRTAFPTPQGDPSSPGVILPVVIQFCEYRNRALCAQGCIPGTARGRLSLTGAKLAVLPPRAPAIGSTARVSKALSTEEIPSQHTPRQSAPGGYRLPAVAGAAHPSGAGSSAQPPRTRPRPPTRRTTWSDA